MRHLKIFLRDFHRLWQVADRGTFFRYSKQVLLSAPEIWRGKTLKHANERMRGGVCHFRLPGGGAVTLDGKFFGIAKELYCRGVYFALPGFELGPDDCVVDLGAHVGGFTTLAAVSAKKVVCVEAQAGLLPVIESNLAANRCREKVAVEWGLVGAGTGLFSSPARRRAASHYVKEPPVIAVSELFARHGLERVDFLKVDIEGSEYDLFGGEAGWLKAVRRVAMEVHFDFGDPARLAARLERAGFEVWLMNNDQQVVTSFDRRHGEDSGYIFAKRRAGDCAERPAPALDR
jgi:FkbM family methyltransferase